MGSQNQLRARARGMIYAVYTGINKYFWANLSIKTTKSHDETTIHRELTTGIEGPEGLGPYFDPFLDTLLGWDPIRLPLK